jgi:2-polyprenyl-3-methyl-5-hydroxy-6-metoxy-1,4-benzoquinol methylase
MTTDLSQLPGAIQDQLRNMEEALALDGAVPLHVAAHHLPLEVFAQLTLGVPEHFPHIQARLPSMPSDEVQRNWTGNCGSVLLGQSLSFIRSLLQFHSRIAGKPIDQCRILDFGCGWGRLLRLLLKFTPEEKLFGVDPWDQSIELCRSHGLKCRLAQSDYLPRTLPVDGRFDVIFSFSVFTHLSMKTARIALATLRELVSDTGFLCLTIRPVEYWKTQDSELCKRMEDTHFASGFAFHPHGGHEIEGDKTYGDASMSLECLQSLAVGWKIYGTEWSAADPLQLIVVLAPARTEPVEMKR